MKRPADSPALAIAALADAAHALATAGVTAWLTDGTLLGAIRERAFIPHDLDMDLGAMITEYTQSAIPELTAAGFQLVKTLGTPEDGLQHKLMRDGFRIDIFWHYDRPTGGVQHSAYDRRGRITYEYDHLTLAPLEFLGRTFWAPTPPRLHLVQKYGPDWRTPVTDWDWADGPVNARRAP